MVVIQVVDIKTRSAAFPIDDRMLAAFMLLLPVCRKPTLLQA
jgi:hypothetical protein